MFQKQSGFLMEYFSFQLLWQRLGSVYFSPLLRKSHFFSFLFNKITYRTYPCLLYPLGYQTRQADAADTLKSIAKYNIGYCIYTNRWYVIRNNSVPEIMINMLTKRLASQKQRTETDERMLYLLTPMKIA